MEPVDPLAVVVLLCLLVWAFFSGVGACYLWFLYTSRPHGFFRNHSLAEGEGKSREFLEGLDSRYVKKSMRAILAIEGAMKYGTLTMPELLRIMQDCNQINPELREFLSGLESQYVEKSMRAIIKIEGALKDGTLTIPEVLRIMQGR